MIATAPLHLTDEEFRLISDRVYRHCGIDLNDGKRNLIQARLARRIRACDCSSFHQYLDLAREEAGGVEFGRMIDAITTNLTSFFRESGHFDYLKEHHLPAMLGRKLSAAGGQPARIRVWSAGCSSGEEAYTLAMVLLDQLAKAGGSWDLKILATDLSRRVLRNACSGCYVESRTEDIPADLRSRYFVREAGQDGAVSRAGDALRKVLRFNYLNLVKPWPFAGPFDFIFCRNVMIYFDQATQEKLVNRFWNGLESGGLLFTGHSESLTGLAHRFRYVRPTIYGR